MMIKIPNKLFVVIGFIVYLLFGVLSREAMAFSINVDPPAIIVSVPAGGSERGVIKLTNKGDQALKIIVYAEDWIYGIDGSKIFKAPGATSFSCANWLHIFPTEFELPGGETKEVQYTLTVPLNASGGHYGVIFFESVLGKTQSGKGASVKIAGRIGTLILQETEGRVDRTGSIVSLTTSNPDENKALDITLVFKNEGNVRIEAKTTINIIDNDGNFLGREEFPDVKTLPGDVREIKGSWLGKLPVGEYILIATVDAGEGNALIKETKLAVVKKGQLDGITTVLSPEGNPSFSVKFTNTGNITMETKGKIEIIDTSGQVVKTLLLKERLVLPNSEGLLTAGLESPLLPGEYKIQATVMYDDQVLSKGETLVVKE